tara:strand:+ start:288 stop:512 length:225 start_codon:yes stop_codon:yes gene_type:complete
VKKLKPIIFISFFIFIVLTLEIYQSFDSNKIKRIEREKLIIKLNKCFDLENKNIRKVDESLYLIEYCIKKYGTK